jgi:hypothetical protein
VHWLGELKHRSAVGAGGRTRTDTTFYGPRILSPVRLPFRHTGFLAQKLTTNSPQVKRELSRKLLKFFATLKKKRQCSTAILKFSISKCLKTVAVQKNFHK